MDDLEPPVLAAVSERRGGSSNALRKPSRVGLPIGIEVAAIAGIQRHGDATRVPAGLQLDLDDVPRSERLPLGFERLGARLQKLSLPDQVRDFHEAESTG